MKKILSVLVFSLLTFTFVGCEGFNQPSYGGSNKQDEYYVKYSITTTRQYHYFRGVTYADINGMITTKEKESPSRVWNITIGPVKKGFRASIQYNEGGTCQIEVSKNNGPFALKAEGKNSASYTIDF